MLLCSRTYSCAETLGVTEIAVVGLIAAARPAPAQAAAKPAQALQVLQKLAADAKAICGSDEHLFYFYDEVVRTLRLAFATLALSLACHYLCFCRSKVVALANIYQRRNCLNLRKWCVAACASCRPCVPNLVMLSCCADCFAESKTRRIAVQIN